MNYYKIILALLLCLCSVIPAIAKVIPFSVDAAQFRYDSAHTLWEMYYSFPNTAIVYENSKEGMVSEVYMKAIIFSAQDTVVAQEWIVTDRNDTASSGIFKNLVGQKSFLLKPGQYTVSLHIVDLNDTSSHTSFAFAAIIRVLPLQGFAASDMEISSSFQNAVPGINSPFKKGSLIVIPNPDKEYTGAQQNLLVYSEIYNATAGFKVRYTILDGAKREVFSSEKVQQEAAEAIVETGTLSLEFLPSGVYYVQMTVFTPAANHTDSTVSPLKKFYVINPDLPSEPNPFFTEDQLFLSSEFAAIGDEKIKMEFEKAQYIATLQEAGSYNSLTDSRAKQKFLFRFWASRDSDTSTVVNETLEEYRKQIAYATTYFSNIQIKEGWRTDRGRVRLKYGAPSEVARADYNVGGKPYEIWTYNNIQGGNIIFCFVDLNGYNNYKLVHSTARGEVRDERWKERYVDANNFDPNGDMNR